MFLRYRGVLRRLSPLTSRVMFLAIIVLSIGVFSAGVAAFRLWHDAKIGGEEQANSLGILFAEQTRRSLQAVDFVLQELQAYGNASGVNSPEGFDRHYGSFDLFEKMRDRLKVLPQTDAFAAVSATGKLVNLSREWPTPDLDLSGREYVRHCRDAPGQDVFVTGRIESRVGKVPAFYLARCLTGPGGQLVGIVMAVPTIPYYLDLYRSLGLPKGVSVAIRRASGDALLAYPISGQDAPPQMPDAADTRFVSRHPISFSQLVFEVGVSRERAFSIWRKQLAWIAIGSVCTLTCLLLLLGQLVGAIRRVEQSREALLDRSNELEERTRSLLETARALRDSEAELKRQTTLLELTLDHMDQGLVMINADTEIAVCNKRCAEMLDIPQTLLKSSPKLNDVIAHQSKMNEFADPLAPPIEVMAQIPTGTAPRTYERTRPNGVSLEVRSVPLADGGMVRTYTDITVRKQAEAKLAFLAYHDQLTGLANRHLLYKILRAKLPDGPHFAVLLLDLDRFKLVNDTLGHGAGDLLLLQVARRMEAHVRAGDLVARLGGDEFAAVLVSAASHPSSMALAERLKLAVSAPYEIEGETVRIGVSIGIALSPQDGTETDALMANADSALYRAKASGRDAIRCYETGAGEQDRQRLVLEHDLRIALEQEQFEIAYQPIFNIISGVPHSYEALVRWRHPSRGMLSPDQFIPIAEETGIINELGRWVLEAACREAATWSIPVRVAVNVSTVQFTQPGLEAQVLQALEASGLPGGRLDLEVTESVLITDGAQARETMLSLQRRGVRFVMDDFGTGHSSLHSLQGYPFQLIKIDRSFIQGMDQEAGAGAIVRAMLTIAAAMGLDVVAEGVETQAQADRLRELGCRLVQGYLLQRPQSPEHVRDYLWRFQRSAAG